MGVTGVQPDPLSAHDALARAEPDYEAREARRDLLVGQLREAHLMLSVGAHLACVLLLSRGVHAKFVQELLGHATISVTLDTHSHVLPSMTYQTATTMEDVLS